MLEFLLVGRHHIVIFALVGLPVVVKDGTFARVQRIISQEQPFGGHPQLGGDVTDVAVEDAGTPLLYVMVGIAVHPKLVSHGSLADSAFLPFFLDVYLDCFFVHIEGD